MTEHTQQLNGNSEGKSCLSSSLACSECDSTNIGQNKPNIHSLKNSLVYIAYIDHLLFRNKEAKICQPAIRETVGWIIKENSLAVWLLWDRNLKKNPEEEVDAQSGLIILRNDIIKLRPFRLSEVSGMYLCRSIAQPANGKSKNKEMVENYGNR